MKKQLNFVLLLALGAGTMVRTAAAQQANRFDNRDGVQFSYGISITGQGGQLQPADWDDHRRWDGDHDRDDRGSWVIDQYGNRYYRGGNTYYGRGNDYQGNYTQRGGYYDRKGNFYPDGANGYYDKHGRWHYFTGRAR